MGPASHMTIVMNQVSLPASFTLVLPGVLYERIYIPIPKFSQNVNRQLAFQPEFL